MRKLFAPQKKLIYIIIIIFALTTTAITVSKPPKPGNKAVFGVSFSLIHAKYLGLDWQDTYLKILDDLKVKFLRLPSYWSYFEAEEGKVDFTDLDFMVDEAQKRNVKIILVVGAKQPRWPECHIPSWAKSLSVRERQEKTLQFLTSVVNRYKDKKALLYWQVENEPLWAFGENCDPQDLGYLKQEVELVRKLDPNHKIVITDTGEWSFWIESMKLSDILGISMYKKTYNRVTDYNQYPFPMSFYTLKSSLIRKFFAPQNLKTIIAELQTEPWLAGSAAETPTQQQVKFFTLKDLQETVDSAQKTDFDEIYLWGVEWWYYMAQRNHPEYLEYAKSIFGAN